jgi:hypothetical protein
MQLHRLQGPEAVGLAEVRYWHHQSDILTSRKYVVTPKILHTLHSITIFDLLESISPTLQPASVNIIFNLYECKTAWRPVNDVNGTETYCIFKSKITMAIE